MSSRRALAILIGIILIVSGIVFFFGIPGIFEVEKTPDNVWGVILLVGGGLITFFAALNEATEFIQKLFSRERKDLLRREKPYDINGPSNLQNRLNVIANVHEAWIKGVLENNLQDAVRLELDLQEIPGVLMRPNIRLRYQTNDEHAISPGVSIYQIFQESGQNLLILGAPGSGKTFTMLQLARDLLNAAERSEQASVPIVLNLSSWAKEQLPLGDWIADEIWLQYQLAKKVTYAWLEHDQLCLLLDGLDEVAQEHRQACVEAINTLKLEHSSAMVVCSRTTDYASLVIRLNLSRAIEIQPLTEIQVEEYLSRPELQLHAVRATLYHDRDLRELATTPLFLNVIALAYRGKVPEELSILKSKETRHYHLFNTYIRRMFKHRPPLKGLSYAPRRAFGWLVYLACQLSQRELAAFFVERLQMDWLQHADQRKYLCFTGLVGGLVVGLIGVLVVGLVGKPVLELVIGPTYAPAYVLLFGLIAGLAFGLQLVKYPRTISPVDQVNLRRPRWINLVITLAGGLITGLIVGWVAGLFIGLLVGLGIFLQLMVEEILVPVESERREQPNQGIHRTLQNLIRRYILINMLILGLGAGLVAGLSFGLAAGLLAGLAFGLTAALIGGLVSPASQTVTRHYFLRWKLHREGLLPLKLRPFLDAMTERLLLRRVGGGYIFIHRTLMEHFASLSEDELDVLAARIEA